MQWQWMQSLEDNLQKWRSANPHHSVLSFHGLPAQDYKFAKADIVNQGFEDMLEDLNRTWYTRFCCNTVNPPRDDFLRLCNE
jgi:hypothetical protein